MLPGSAGLDLLAPSGETLAGRIAYLELGPLQCRETGSGTLDALWLRGGFPDGYAPSPSRTCGRFSGTDRLGSSNGRTHSICTAHQQRQVDRHDEAPVDGR